MNGKKYKKNLEFRTRRISGMNVMLTDEKAFELNETAKAIWDLLEGESTVDSIVAAMQKQYQIERGPLQQDVESTLQLFLQMGAVIETC